jgi:chromosome segregation ATPase
VIIFFFLISERDDLERRFNDCKAQLAANEATQQILAKERDELRRKSGQLKQEISLHKQDKEYFQRQLVDTQTRCRVAEQRLNEVQTSADEAKKRIDDLQDKYTRARDSYKSEYENRLVVELDELKARTNKELEQLRTNSRELHDREIRQCIEAKEQAILDKEKHELNEKETCIKYEQAMSE